MEIIGYIIGLFCFMWFLGFMVYYVEQVKKEHDDKLPSGCYWILVWLMIHCWYFIIETDVEIKVLLFLVVIISSASNQFIHWAPCYYPPHFKSGKMNVWKSLTVAHRTYVISNLFLCLYSFALMKGLVAM